MLQLLCQLQVATQQLRCVAIDNQQGAALADFAQALAHATSLHSCTSHVLMPDSNNCCAFVHLRTLCAVVSTSCSVRCRSTREAWLEQNCTHAA
jgi:hypothetical protein